MPKSDDTRPEGRSFTGQQDMRSKTARPTSVGPHHARDKQEDPANPGIRPQEGYAKEIAEVNRARAGQDAGLHKEGGHAGGAGLPSQAETVDESGATEAMRQEAGGGPKQDKAKS